MTTPTDITLANYNGSWVMDRTLSDPTDPVLAMQGLSWFMRTTLAWVTVTLNTKQYASEEAAAAAAAAGDNPVQHIDVENIVTGGIQGSTERRITDWKKRQHTDNIFGRVEGQTRLLRGVKGADGRVRPVVSLCTKLDEAKIARFLRGEVLADGSEEAEGFLVDDGVGGEYGEGEGLWLQSYVESLDSSWTAEQIWGFEMINGVRYHTRRVVIANKGDFVLARLVYSWVPPEDDSALAEY
ncbi:hypothetical protein ARAM_005619 [Aspergillus rambellii]|uniref:Uncharacterized protein n=1 Tax=Aspergillus rambellii TaxID=308745 RepID=A0A0F8XJ84_9EURO|nr:hypothetical protein ARAM_005619 [Aspergillus rambellii]